MIKMTFLYRLPIAHCSLQIRKRVYIDDPLIQLSNGTIDNRYSLAARLVPLVGVDDGQGLCNVRMFTEPYHRVIDM
jgi:hypothetical protein